MSRPAGVLTATLPAPLATVASLVTDGARYVAALERAGVTSVARGPNRWLEQRQLGESRLRVERALEAATPPRACRFGLRLAGEAWGLSLELTDRDGGTGVRAALTWRPNGLFARLFGKPKGAAFEAAMDLVRADLKALAAALRPDRPKRQRPKPQGKGGAALPPPPAPAGGEEDPLEPLLAALTALCRPGWLLYPVAATDLRAVGWFGGRPVLPEGLDWPTGPEGSPLTFLAELDLDRFTRVAAQGEHDLPPVGRLLAFADLGDPGPHPACSLFWTDVPSLEVPAGLATGAADAPGGLAETAFAATPTLMPPPLTEALRASPEARGGVALLADRPGLPSDPVAAALATLDAEARALIPADYLARRFGQVLGAGRNGRPDDPALAGTPPDPDAVAILSFAGAALGGGGGLTLWLAPAALEARRFGGTRASRAG